jgi:hypothetical protein
LNGKKNGRQPYLETPKKPAAEVLSEWNSRLMSLTWIPLREGYLPKIFGPPEHHTYQQRNPDIFTSPATASWRGHWRMKQRRMKICGIYTCSMDELKVFEVMILKARPRSGHDTSGFWGGWRDLISVWSCFFGGEVGCELMLLNVLKIDIVDIFS